MRINHNIAALNTYSRLSQATTGQAKSLEKLSSGQRINKAGDDAAGLAISEKMRSQIRGLGQASRNAQDGISMIQTAEGALGETHSILQRMRELAVQSANDTNTSSDRGEIQKEVNQLSSEINRIAGTTEFNKQTLLDGGQSAGSVKGISVGVTNSATSCTGAKYEYNFTCVRATAAPDEDIAFFGGACDAATNPITCAITCTTANGVASQLAAQINLNCSAWKAEAVGGKLIVSAVNSCAAWGTTGNCTSILTFGCAMCYDLKVTDGTCACAQVTSMTFTQDGIKEGVTISSGNCSIGLWNSQSGTYANSVDAKIALGVDGIIDIACYDGSVICVKDLLFCSACTNGGAIIDCTSFSGITFCKIGENTLTLTTCVGVCSGAEQTAKVKSVSSSGVSGTNGITLQIGANTSQTFTVGFEDMTGKGIKVTTESASQALTTSTGAVAYFTSDINVENNGTTNQFSLDISTAEKATSAISAIDDAIGKVSSERSKLGAFQNRLEHTIANLDTSAENLTGAESRIRDVDMAKEMMEFTKNNILNQAATAMLAQANQQPQGVLQLLR